MDRVARAESRRGRSRAGQATSIFRFALMVRNWQVWQLPLPLRALVLAVTCAYAAWMVVAANGFTIRAHDLVLVAALLGCGAATVELTRRASEPAGIVKDVYAVWELPVVILLPVPYALIVPAIRLALTQWRVRRAPPHRRAFTAAAIGLAYGCASLVFHAIIPRWSGRAGLPVEPRRAVAAGGRVLRPDAVGGQPGPGAARRQGLGPGHRGPGRPAGEGVAAQRRDRVVRRDPRRPERPGQPAHADCGVPAGDPVAAVATGTRSCSTTPGRTPRPGCSTPRRGRPRRARKWSARSAPPPRSRWRSWTWTGSS